MGVHGQVNIFMNIVNKILILKNKTLRQNMRYGLLKIFQPTPMS